MRIKGNGNVGIGTSAPAYKLDIEGRLRLQHSTGTAGVYFDGVTMPTRSFIGTFDDNYAGLYGGGGAGWNFVMNVNNGNIGIGTTAPTTKLDINGSIRIRGSAPKTGSVLTSSDVNENAVWGDPISFRATGGFDGLPNTLNNVTWTKINFNQSLLYNLGLGFQPINSQFVVPEKGIYHFNSQLHWEEEYLEIDIRIRLNRNGNISTIAESYTDRRLQVDNGIAHFKEPSSVATDVSLEAGDIVWVEGYALIHSTFGTTTTISTLPHLTWFAGHLVTRY